MSLTLAQIAQQLTSPRSVRKKMTTETEVTGAVPKVQLIYGFNGMGKTRLSREMKELVAPKSEEDEEADLDGFSQKKFLYYNAFTEDLFYWDNDLDDGDEPKLKIQPNLFTNWILGVQGKGSAIVSNFQRYTNDKLTPLFKEEDILFKGSKTERKNYPEVTFSLDTGTERSGNIKISKGEESNFIWSVFYTLLEQVIFILNVVDPTARETDQFNQLEYVFIDDPVSSLDENHLIELAVNLAGLIKTSTSDLKFVITTHNTLFYNVLYNELSLKTGFILSKLEDGTFTLEAKQGDSNKSFSYHLYLKQILEKAIAENTIEKYHFTLLRNLYEKTANFLDYPKWSELLPDDKQAYYNRVIQFTSHSTLSNETAAEPTPQEKQIVGFLLNHLKNTKHGYWMKKEETNAGTN